MSRYNRWWSSMKSVDSSIESVRNVSCFQLFVHVKVLSSTTPDLIFETRQVGEFNNQMVRTVENWCLAEVDVMVAKKVQFQEYLLLGVILQIREVIGNNENKFLSP